MWSLPYPGVHLGGGRAQTLEVSDSWRLAQLLPIAGAQCRLESDCQRKLRSERGGILSEVTQLATVGGKVVDCAKEYGFLLSGTADLRPHLPINLTDLSVNRNSQLPLRLCGHKGCHDDVIKCWAQDLVRCQPELPGGGWTLVSAKRLPTASPAPNMSLLSSGPLLLPVGGEGRQEWDQRGREQSSDLWPASCCVWSTQLPGEYITSCNLWP